MVDVAMLPPSSPMSSPVHSIKVKYGKRPVLVLNAGPDMSVGALKERVEVEFGVGKSRQKLVAKGTRLLDDNAIVSDVLERGATLMLVSSTDAEVEKLQSNAKAVQHEMQVKEQRRNNKNYVSISQRMQGGSRVDGMQSISETYGFMSFETLTGFDDEARASTFLKSLAEDVGIQHVMRKYKWKVGKLTEMYPEVCIFFFLYFLMTC